MRSMPDMVSTRIQGRRGGPAWIFLSIGIVVFLALAVAATIVGWNEHRKSDWPVTHGEVVDVVERVSTSRDSDGHRRTRTTWAPVVTFNVDGTEYTFTSKVSYGNPPQIGSTVEVRHNPDDPHDADLAGGLVWVVFMLGGMAVLFLAAFGGTGLVLLRHQRRNLSTPGQDRTAPQDWGRSKAEPDGPIDPAEPR